MCQDPENDEGALAAAVFALIVIVVLAVSWYIEQWGLSAFFDR